MRVGAPAFAGVTLRGEDDQKTGNVYEGHKAPRLRKSDDSLRGELKRTTHRIVLFQCYDEIKDIIP